MRYNYGARAYSIRALAAIADPCALDVLVTAAATDFAPSVPPLLPGIGNLALEPAGCRSAPPLKPKPKRLLSVSKTRTGRFCAAVVGLQALSTMPDLKGQIQHSSSKWLELTRARVSLAQQLFHI